MVCEFCNTDTVTWRGPFSNLTHTECSQCGRTNCQRIDPVIDDEDNTSEADELPNCVWRGAETPFAENH